MNSAADNRPKVELFTDGACLGNPGPGGWAFILKHPASGRSKRNSGGERGTTNNRMEIIAAIRSLEMITKPSRIELYSDSQYVVKGITEWLRKWKQFGFKPTINARDQVKNADLWKRLDELLQRHTLAAYWVRGHDGHPENETCDAMASAAAARVAQVPTAPRI